MDCSNPGSALLVIDVQNGFCNGGALAVPGGDEVVDPINRLMSRFANVILTQDWHTPGHAAFASAHATHQPFDVVELSYGSQVLWPDHCVAGTTSAQFHPALAVDAAQLVVRKGFHPGVDSYSAFLEADRTTRTGLTGYLKERGIDSLYLCGLATDFCVAYTAIDARAQGFAVTVVTDACRAIDLNGSLARSLDEMSKVGVHFVCAAEFG
jgi:nicotinamidase/pyrazinamidase